ncbi:DUF3261 domain-containing protein [Achromobacter ruhlandii]|uniref:DUF3261 domain-containing protein n=4 Tax=Achromobacter TaxID=222 RepID=A0ABM8M439_9BURK|nr:DUF3261 domain-containing protein [Achromobacter ruhlandii]AKP91208.1 Lipoprotein [Achromobacter xylosoxidans]AMG47282.1 hypothetical protein AL520_26130 [Achromobacter xylosoxidans]MCV6799007.1 DUF3261 domain-containing protein [Achromobacter ruhlandii]MCV6811567.1 DUF3261 domain-containing protein [Achromobacter ruhlandii]MCV6822517.1 DUF3261 domain-containing protein [Achromobacter ruhlandii]
MMPVLPSLPPALRAACAALALAVLAGCASAPPVPARPAGFALPRQLHVIQSSPGLPTQDTLLVVQREASAMRWSLFDPMGVPQARQMLEDGRWRNDGFLRPNGQARDLFAALLFAWTPQAELDAAYGAGAWRATRAADGSAQRELLQRGLPRWTVRWPADAPDGALEIRDAAGTVWRVAPLKEQP